MKFSRILICYLLIVFISTTSIASRSLNFDEIRIYDSYGKLSWKDEKLRLDALAYELKNEQAKSVAYLYFYGGRRSCVSEAQKRSIRAKNYLINKQGILNERIVLKEGGYREQLTIEVYILPTDYKMNASPTLTGSEVQKNCSNQK